MSRVSTASFPTGGDGRGRSALAKVLVGLILPVATAMVGCRIHTAGLVAGGGTDDFAQADAGGDDGGAGDGLGESDASGDDAGEPADLAPVVGDPTTVGCSDGTRDGFRDLGTWPRIAGCAGGWQVAGLLAKYSRTPLCNRIAGNSSENPEGAGCSAADLCALTWHTCLDGPDVASHSPTGDCQGIVSPEEQALFVVMVGASPQGVCCPDPTAANDLHGCGTIGEPDSGGCPPLDRRMGFAECAATGVWQCGDEDSIFSEADVVTKPGSSLGGVLCCKD